MNVHEQAVEAAQHWNGRIVRLIRNRENAVFEMTLPQGRAALRLHRPGYHDEAAIRSELWWCAALADAGIPVPHPLPSLSGAPLVNLPNGRIASAIQWVVGDPLGESGRPFDAPLTQTLARHTALGCLVAQVHSATDRLTLPADFSRPLWDIEGLVGETPFWGRFWQHPSLASAEATTMARARDFLRERLTDHARSGDFGPIHADVMRENVLVNDHSLSLIDFDDSGLGFRLYDLGTVLSQNLYEPAYPQIRDALIAGYAETRPADVATVELFTLARTCASVAWTAPRLAAGDPVHRRYIAIALMWAARMMG